MSGHPFAVGDKVRFTHAATDTDTVWEVWQAHSRDDYSSGHREDYHWCAVVSEKGGVRYHVNAGRLEKVGGPIVNRQEAIGVLLEFAYLAQQEFGVGNSTIVEGAREALKMLGVTEDEINNNEETGQ